MIDAAAAAAAAGTVVTVTLADAEEAVVDKVLGIIVFSSYVFRSISVFFGCIIWLSGSVVDPMTWYKMKI